MPSSSATTSRVQQQQQQQQEEEEPHVVMRQRRGRPSPNNNNNKTTITTSTTTTSIELVDVTPPAVVACFCGGDADAASVEEDAGDEQGEYNNNNNNNHASAAGRTTTLVQSSCSNDNSSRSGELLLPSTRITRDWTTPYVPPPMVQQSTIMVLGSFIFCLAMIWPPLILLLTYLAAKLIPYSFRENDDPAVRRELFHQFSQEADHLPDRFKNIHRYVDFEESYWKNERGMLLATSIMTPKHGQPIRAVACYCHGYTDHASFSARMHYQKLVERGIAVVSIEYEGHGRSDGAFGLINDWDVMTNDVAKYFSQVVTSDRFRPYPAFLVGESMGGAVAYCVYDQLPTLFRGVVLVCPMCKISDDMLPPQFVIDILRWLIGPTGTTSLLGFLPIAPSNNDLADVIHRVPEKGILNHQPPLNFGRHPRLATARELINVTQRISNSISTFTAPFLVLHGLADRVTDPKLSQVLYDESSSTDKTIRLYEDMWHGLTCGEPDECADQVFADITNWILARSS